MEIGGRPNHQALVGAINLNAGRCRGTIGAREGLKGDRSKTIHIEDAIGEAGERQLQAGVFVHLQAEGLELPQRINLGRYHDGNFHHALDTFAIDQGEKQGARTGKIGIGMEHDLTLIQLHM